MFHFPFYFSIHALKIPTVNFSKLAVSFTICQPQLLTLLTRPRPYSLSIHKPIIHSMWINAISIDLLFRWLCRFLCDVRALLVQAKLLSVFLIVYVCKRKLGKINENKPTLKYTKHIKERIIFFWYVCVCVSKFFGRYKQRTNSKWTWYYYKHLFFLFVCSLCNSTNGNHFAKYSGFYHSSFSWIFFQTSPIHRDLNHMLLAKQ